MLTFVESFSDVRPERTGENLDNVSAANQNSRFGRRHALLLEVDADQRKETAERRVVEQIEQLAGDHFVIAKYFV